jgi:hypothetical protein
VKAEVYHSSGILADKIFANVLLIFLACSHPGWISLWMVLLLVAREYAVQRFRSVTPCLGVVISTGRLNKLKLVLQLVAVGIALVGLGWSAVAWLLKPAAWIALGLALLSAYASMYTLFRDNADLWGRAQIDMEKRRASGLLENRGNSAPIVNERRSYRRHATSAILVHGANSTPGIRPAYRAPSGGFSVLRCADTEGQVSGTPSHEGGGQGDSANGAPPVLGVQAPSDQRQPGDDANHLIDIAYVLFHSLCAPVI